MTTFKRRALWGVLALALVLAGAALYIYIVGTRTLLEHAEAFAFRRMQVAKVEDEAFRFFYVTNRRPLDLHGPVEGRFAVDRGESLSFGSFDTSIEPTLGLGIIIDPSAWFLNEEIKLRDVRALQQEAFLEKLRQQVEASPQRSLLLIVHGFREAFPSALRKTAFLAHVLDIDTPVVVFDWPGNQGSSLRGYRRAREVARASGAELASTLKLIIEEVRPRRLWLGANSMGGQVVADAFSVLSQDPQFSDPAPEIENVLLSAPDVDRASFTDRFKRDMRNIAGNVTVYVSSNDRALLVSRIINRGARLGESSLDPRNPGQLEEAEQFYDMLEPGDSRLVLVDVTSVNRTRNFHNFSLETPEFFDDAFLRLTGPSNLTTRELYLIRTPDGSHYHVLTRGR